ncbi:cytochrome P450 [Metarhizium robertsii]|uniref:Cytochrome P450 n=1 Tax=Metarhizium robertsii TaxID=568076 RepID=A0A0A1UT82_9HYPO|nr:cytochrome P450 [Metarhizium robertsii]
MMSFWVLNHLSRGLVLYGLCLMLAVTLSALLNGLFSHKRNELKPRSSRFILLEPFYTLKSRLVAWSFLIRGPSIIQTTYEKSNGAPFSVDTPNNTIVLVSDWKHIKEINAAPEGTLSLLGAAKDVLQPKHTMTNFNWTNKRGSDGAPLQMALRGRLAGHLPVLVPEIRSDLSTFFDQRFQSFPTVLGAKQGAIFPLILGAVARSNAHAFFGPELSRDATFLAAGIKMIEHTLIIAEILRMVPGIVSDPLGKFLSSRLDSGSVMTDALVAVVSERFRDAELRKLRHDIPEKNDCIQWIMDHAPRHKPWGVMRVVHELIAVWFGSVHIASTTACAAIYDLCDRPEYVDILREEIEQTGWEAFDKAGGQILPLMDSFLKESARLNPIESVSTRRKVLKPFHFSDGTSVQPGQWVCSAPRAMNRNPETWAKADEFYGFRFVKPESFTIPEAGKASEYINLSDWQQWGTGKASCTGRWYAAAAIKTMIGLFITKYDFQLVDPKAKRYFSWRTFIYPYEGTPIALTPRMVLDKELGQ